MEWEPGSPSRNHTYPGQWQGSPRRRSGWELEFRDCGAILGQGLLLTVERLVEGMWGRRLWWESLWRRARQPRKQDDTAESCVKVGAITIASLSPHTCISSWTIERLAHQTSDTLNYGVGPHPGCSFKRLMHETIEQDPTQGAPLSAWRADL